MKRTLTLSLSKGEGQPSSDRELAPHRHMVGRLVPATHMFVDAAGLEAIGRLRRQHNVIDADAVILLPCARLVVPEGVAVRLRVTGAECIGEAEILDALQRRTGFRLVQLIAHPCFGIPYVV